MKKRLCLFMSLCLVFMLLLPIGPIKAATTYKLNAATRTLNGVGKKCTLKLTAPKSATATWKSSNSKIASVTKKGVVTAKKKGKVTITCTVKNGTVTKKLTCKVTVKVPAKAIEFTNAVINSEYDAHVIELGTPYDFACKRISSSTKSASSDVIRYYVKDTAKASVDAKKGIVTPLKTGYTTLTVCCGATATKAKAETNKVKQTINLYIVKPSITVTDCTLANSHELQFTFSHEMDSTSLLTGTTLSSAVSIKPASGAADLGKLSGALSEDGKILTISSTNAFDGNYDISLNKNAASKTGYALTPYTESKLLKDTVNPIYTGCTVDDTGLIVSLNFSEPIRIDALVPSEAKRTDGKTLAYSAPFLTKTSYTLSEDKKSILLDLTSITTADQNVSVDVTLYGIVDLANNTTNPYPLVATVFTNTTASAQADLQNVYRNGNSIVAVFNKTMKTPGYLIASGIYQSGEINSDNKKEIIYHLTDSTLLQSKASLSVVLYNYSAYNASITSTTTQRTVNFGAAASLPSVTGSSFTTKTENSVTSTVLTLTYDKEINLISKSGSLSGRSTLDGIVSADTLYTYTATASEKTVTVTFTDTFTELANYTFSIPAAFVVDNYYNNNALQAINVTKLTGDSAVLPAPSGIQIAGASNQYVYITFDNMLDQATAEMTANYSISGITIESAQLISNTYHSPAIVKLTVPQGTIATGAPYQVRISGIKGYKGSYTAMDSYQAMITLSNNKTLEYTTVTVSSANNTVTLNFLTRLVNSTPTNIDYTATIGSSTCKIKSAVVDGTTVTFTFTDKLQSKSTLVLTPSSNNYLVDVNNQRLLNTAISVVIP